MLSNFIEFCEKYIDNRCNIIQTLSSIKMIGTNSDK